MDIQLEKKPFIVRYRYYLAAGAAFVGLLVYLLIAASGPQKLKFDSDRAVIAEVKRDRFREYLDVEGAVLPRLTIKLNSAEAGAVERIVAEDGAILKAGDTILILANPELTRSIEDDRDALEKQQVAYREKQISMERKSAELKRQSLENEYRLQKQQRESALNEEEFRMGYKSKAQYEVAVEEYEYNLKNSALLVEQLRHDSILNAIETELLRSDLTREEKKYARSRSRLDELVVRAPLDGQLSSVKVIPGARVGSGTEIGEMKVVDRFKINTHVSEYYIDRIATGLPATVVYQNERYPLRITKINPEIRDRQFEVDLVFTDAQPDNVRIGKSFRVQIELEQPEEALVVERGTFFQYTGGQWIFRLDRSGKLATKTSVSIGRQNPRQYEILDGLEEGDRVIVSGYDAFGSAEVIEMK